MMNAHHRFKVIAAAVMALIITIVPTTALLNADNSARPMMSHDFTDVPVSGQEFMEPYINAFYHMGITGGCSTSPLQYCPTNPVTRGSMAVFMGRALGYVDLLTEPFSARAYFKQTDTDSDSHGVAGTSINGRGVFGTSTGGSGVLGSSDSGSGVFALSNSGSALTASSGNGVGVFALSSNSYGVSAFSSNETALVASSGANGFFDGIYDISLGGSYGEIHGVLLDFYSNDNVYIELDNDNNTASAFFGIYNSLDSLLFSVAENGAVTINGNYTATGTKSAIVSTVNHGDRLMYAVEATEVLFEDVGSAELIDGEAIIEIDPIFTETVNLEQEYQVFLTPVGGSGVLYVAEKTATQIVIRSDDATDLRFDYRIVAKRLGYEDVRMEEVED